MTYEEALRYIASLEPRGWRLGLDRMQEFVRQANLQDSIGGVSGPQFIHVAGTNGKGSTTAFLQSLLVESGYRTGAFFSPFVVDPRERVQFGRNLIAKKELANVTEKLLPVAESLTETEFGGITEFEFKTALGFQYWKQKNCEWVALEVGLGGRLDATNVVTPQAGIIVSIGLDHTHILGETLEAIAFEKAGIIKPGVPIVVGDLPEVAEAVIIEVAHERRAPIWRWGREVVWCDREQSVTTPKATHRGLSSGITGVMQNHNLSLAIAALDASGAFRNEVALKLGAFRASLPGRFQQMDVDGRIVLLDGAHNTDAAEVLLRTLDAQFPDRKYTLVTNMLAGHEHGAFYSVLKDRIKSVHVVPVHFHRSTPVAEMAEKLSSVLPDVSRHSSVEAGIKSAIEDTPPGEIILVTGSFYLVGEVLRLNPRNHPNTGSR